jgi:hypothetical protein
VRVLSPFTIMNFAFCRAQHAAPCIAFSGSLL